MRHRAHAPIEIQRSRHIARLHGQEALDRDAGVAIPRAQALEDVVAHAVDDGVAFRELRVPLRRQRQQRLQVEREVVLDDRAQQAERGAAQREGIARAGWRLADAEDTGQRVEAIGQRQRDADLALRQRIAGMARQVLLGERLRDRGILAIVQRVIAAHDALQFIELQHHLGHQVRLAEHCGARAQRRIGAEFRADRTRERRHALGLVPETAKFRLEHDVAQAFAPCFQRGLLVLREEERGIGQARTDHAFVAVDHLLRIAAVDVRHRDEVRQQSARGIHQVEVLLVLLHRGDQRFGRYLEEAFLEAARQRARPFDQAAHFVQQCFVDDGNAAELGGPGAYLRRDIGTPCRVVGDDAALIAQSALVIGGTFQRDARGSVHAMAASLAAGLDAEHFARHHGAAVKHDDPVHGTHEFRAPRTPAHALCDRQCGERTLEQRGQQRGRGLARYVLAMRKALALLAGNAQQRIDLDATATRKPERGTRWLAIGVEGGRYRGSEFFHHRIGLRGVERVDRYRQTARTGEPARGAVHDALLVEAREQFAVQ